MENGEKGEAEEGREKDTRESRLKYKWLSKLHACSQRRFKTRNIFMGFFGLLPHCLYVYLSIKCLAVCSECRPYSNLILLFVTLFWSYDSSQRTNLLNSLSLSCLSILLEIFSYYFAQNKIRIMDFIVID